MKRRFGGSVGIRTARDKLGLVPEIKHDVCETLYIRPGGNKVVKAIFRAKVTVKVTISLTLESL